MSEKAPDVQEDSVNIPEFLRRILKITGIKVSYYHICKTKLWLFSHGITMEHMHENVELGRLLHQESYSRDKRELQTGEISIDFVRRRDGIEIHEVKKSRAMEEAHIAQMKYYLYYLRKFGINAEGVLNYPMFRRTKKVILIEEDMEIIENEIKEIEILIQGDMPIPIWRKICFKCSYLEYCFSGKEKMKIEGEQKKTVQNKRKLGEKK